MRRFLTIGITKTGTVEILQGANKSYTEHRDEFRKLDSGKKKDASHGYAEIQIVDLSRGVRKRKRYSGIKLKGTAADGKRTVARTVEHKDRPAKNRARRTGKANAPAAKKPAPHKAAAPAKTAEPKAPVAAKKADEGTFPEGPQLTP